MASPYIYGPFELPIIPGRGEDDRGLFLLLPNGYGLSIQQRERGFWSSIDNTAEIAVMAPQADGKMVVDGKIIRAKKSSDDVLASVSVEDTLNLLTEISVLPLHPYWNSKLAKLNPDYQPIDPEEMLKAREGAALTPGRPWIFPINAGGSQASHTPGG